MAMTYLADGPSPLLARGGSDIKRNIAKLPLMERPGWWFKIKRKCFFKPEPTTSSTPLRMLRTFFYWRSHPSWPEGR